MGLELGRDLRRVHDHRELLERHCAAAHLVREGVTARARARARLGLGLGLG